MKQTIQWVFALCVLLIGVCGASESTLRSVWREDKQSTVDLELRESFPFAKDFRLIEHGLLGAERWSCPRRAIGWGALWTAAAARCC